MVGKSETQLFLRAKEWNSVKGIKIAARTGPSRPLVSTLNHPEKASRSVKGRRLKKQSLKQQDSAVPAKITPIEDNQRQVSAFFSQMLTSEVQPPMTQLTGRLNRSVTGEKTQTKIMVQPIQAKD